MGIFEKLFQSNNQATPEGISNTSEKPRKLHKDFKPDSFGWHGNKLYMEQYGYNLPASSILFNFKDEDLTDLLEDCPFPVKIKEVSEGNFSGLAFYNEDKDGANKTTLEEWLEHNHAKAA